MLENPHVNSIFALHVSPNIPIGKVSLLKGSVMAAVDNFSIKIIGRGGHCAFPEETDDPITIASHVIVMLNSLMNRKISAFDDVVLSIGKIVGGNRRNIIPNEVFVEGTLRTLNENIRKNTKLLVRKSCEMTSRTFGGKCIFKWVKWYDPTINNPEVVDLVKEGIKRFINENVIYEESKPLMAADDFGYYLKNNKGAYFWLGYKENESKSLHNSQLLINEKILFTGIQSFIGIVFEYFRIIKENKKQGLEVEI